DLPLCAAHSGAAVDAEPRPLVRRDLLTPGVQGADRGRAAVLEFISLSLIQLAPLALFTSPRLRGEVDARSASGEGDSPRAHSSRIPLTPTLSPQAGRGSSPRSPQLHPSNCIAL